MALILQVFVDEMPCDRFFVDVFIATRSGQSLPPPMDAVTNPHPCLVAETEFHSSELACHLALALVCCLNDEGTPLHRFDLKAMSRIEMIL